MPNEQAIAEHHDDGADRAAAKMEAVETAIVDLPLRRVRQFARLKEHALWLPQSPGLNIKLDESQMRRFARASPHRIDHRTA